MNTSVPVPNSITAEVLCKSAVSVIKSARPLELGAIAPSLLYVKQTVLETGLNSHDAFFR